MARQAHGKRTAMVATLGVLALTLAGTSVAGAVEVRQAPADTAFYSPPAKLVAGKPGTVIWARSIQAPAGARAWKVLYRSRLHNGTPVAVSGLVIAPKKAAPKGGHPVVAWAHGTLGGARYCAPSMPANPARNLLNYYSYGSENFIDVGVPALTTFIKKGYVVTATDYQGQGTAGVHQYLVGATEANSIVDSVKAAQHLEQAGAGNDVVVLGWSQGGGAAIFTGQAAAARYAKPLRVRGIVGLAPAADTGPEFAGLTPAGPTTSSSPSHNSVLEMNVFRGFAAAYSELDVKDVVAPAGYRALGALARQCTVHLGDVIQEIGVDPATFFTRPIPADWQRRLNENTAGNQTTVAPVLVLQGTADSVVNPNGSTQYVERACRFAQPVQYSQYPGQNHQTIPYVSQHEYIPWIAARFAGRPAPSNCPG